MTSEEFKRLLNGRRLYLWGAAKMGGLFLDFFNRAGFRPTAWVDSKIGLRPAAGSLPVLTPRELWARPREETCLVITSSAREEISALCRQMGRVEGLDFFYGPDLKEAAAFRFKRYHLDISGRCNLKCISCPRAQYPEAFRPGHMSAQTFAEVLAKLLREDIFADLVTLHNYGEPLLNPDLPEIITLCRDQNVDTVISTNLQPAGNLERVVQARPWRMVVSVSGWGENYETTHTGGRWDRFLANLLRLKEYKDRRHPGLQVQLQVHIYKNREDDYKRLWELGTRLGFKLFPTPAHAGGFEAMEDHLAGRPPSPAQRRVDELVFFPVAENVKIIQAMDRNLPCPMTDRLSLRWDLSVTHCLCRWSSPLLTDNYLQTPLSELAGALRAHDGHCRACRARGLHNSLNFKYDRLFEEYLPHFPQITDGDFA